MDTGKFGIGEVEGKKDCKDFNEAFQIDAVKTEPSEFDTCAKRRSFSNCSSRSETDLGDFKHFTDSYQVPNEEKLDVKNLETKYSGPCNFLENLPINSSTAEIKKDIDIFYEDITRETDEEKSRERIGFCEGCSQEIGEGTDFFKSTSCRSDCSCQKQNELLFHNRHSDDMKLDVKPFSLRLSTDSGLKLFEKQDDISENEVTQERNPCAVPLRLSLLPENDNKMKLNFPPEPLENNLSVYKKKIQCKICSKYFSQIGHLRVHKRGHTGEKPFNCKICSKSFSQKGNMQIHMRVYTGEKPFCCKICSKGFSTLSGLKVHGRIHIEIELIRCKICAKDFTTSRYLRNHARREII